MDEDGDQDYLGDGSDDEDDTNLMDYVQKKVKKKVEPSMETVQLWGQCMKKTTDFRPDDCEVFPMSSLTQSIQLLLCSRLPKWMPRHQH